MEKLKKFFLFSAIFLFGINSLAQSEKSVSTDSLKFYQLSDIVVTATRTPNSTIQIANSISVIDSSEILAKNANNLSELLSSEYGLNVTSQGGAGTLTNVYMRGSNSNYILVLVDGVELNLNNDPSGVFDFSSFPVDNIERIEILRGPQSTLYGSDAMAGIINIITKKGVGKPSLDLSAVGGSYKTYKLSAVSSGRFEKLNYSLSISRSGSEGFSVAKEEYGNFEKDGYLKDQIISNIGLRMNDNISNNFFFRFIRSDADLDQSGITGDDPTYVYNLEETNFSNATNLNLFENFWNQKINLSYQRNVRKYKFDETPNNPASSRSLYDGRKYKFDWQNNFNISSNNLLSVGFDFQYDEALSEYLYFSSFSFESLFPKVNSKTIGGYILEQLKFGESFFVSTGARIDKHDKFGSAVTYQLAPALVFWESGTKIKATLGTGYKAPSLFYLYDPAFGNSDLKPEKSLGIDFGFEQYFWNQNLSIGTTFFVNNFREMFGFDPMTFKTINVNKAQTSGIEFYTSMKLFEKFYLKANYTFTKSFDKSDGVTKDEEKLLRRPEHKAGLFVAYNISDRINSSLETIYVGKRDDKDFSTFPAKRVSLNSYILVNLASSYSFSDLLKLSLRIENLLDKDYEEVFGYSTPGISYYVGLSISPF